MMVGRFLWVLRMGMWGRFGGLRWAGILAQMFNLALLFIEGTN